MVPVGRRVTSTEEDEIRTVVYVFGDVDFETDEVSTHLLLGRVCDSKTRLVD